jgi:hypothetical protein
MKLKFILPLILLKLYIMAGSSMIYIFFVNKNAEAHSRQTPCPVFHSKTVVEM